MTCSECSQSIETGTHTGYCPACGARLWSGPIVRWRRIYRVGIVVLAIAASWLPLMRLGIVPPVPSDNLYQLNPAAWVWLVVVVWATVGTVLTGPQAIWRWARRFWAWLGIASFASAAAVWLSVGVAATVSHNLQAPNPVAVAPGFLALVIVTGVWAVLAVVA